MRAPDRIAAVINPGHDDMPQEEAIDRLARCAGALYAGVDCPLGALVVHEATSGKNAPGRLAVHRAAQRVIDGRARALDDPVLVGAVAECCATRRAGEACPLGLCSPQQAAAAVAER